MTPLTFSDLMDNLKFNNNLREIVDNKADYEKVIDGLNSKLDSSTTEEQITILGSMGVMLRIINKLSESEVALNSALNLARELRLSDKIFITTIRLAHVYQWKKEFKKSEELFLSVEHTLEDNNINPALKAAYYQHYGKLKFDQELYQIALDLFRTSLKIRLEIGAPHNLIESSQQAITETEKRIAKSII